MRHKRGGLDAGFIALLGAGYLYGSILAMIISYVTWRSVFWAIFHSLLSWLYVLYFVARF